MAKIGEAADLYGLPLEEFITERDLLVRRLRDRGEREQAARVAKLRKPTIDAWALNQIARTRHEQMSRLLEAHRTLRGARDGDTLRRASELRRELVEELTDAAKSILDREGRSSDGQVRDRIFRTLLASAGDPDAERALTEGTLDRPAEISADWPSIEAPPRVDRPHQDDPKWRATMEGMESRAQALTDEAAELRRQATEARAALERARRKAEAADRAARRAEGAARKAKEEAKQARRDRRSSPA